MVNNFPFSGCFAQKCDVEHIFRDVRLFVWPAFSIDLFLIQIEFIYFQRYKAA